MAKSSERILWLGTEDGLYRAELNHSGDKTCPSGLQGKGALRAPVVIDRGDSRRLYAATGRGGVFRSEDAGKTWREINDGILYKETWSIVQHPESGELYLGTGPSAVFKSTDGGDTWTDCEQLRTLPETIDWTFPRPPHVSHVKGLALCVEDPLLIVGAVEEGWLIRSKDGGNNWENIKEGTEFDSHFVAVMPGNRSVVIATSGTGVYRSMDGGDHFVLSSRGLDCRYMAQLTVHPKRPNVLFTAAAAGPPPSWRQAQGACTAFYRSENQGDSWEKVAGGLPDHFKAGPRAVAGDPEEPDSFFVGMTDGSVWMSEDSGDSFRPILQELPQITSIRVVHG
jgi:photosystem II stability/assembly factor-like uncharacterized protein